MIKQRKKNVLCKMLNLKVAQTLYIKMNYFTLRKNQKTEKVKQAQHAKLKKKNLKIQ